MFFTAGKATVFEVLLWANCLAAGQAVQTEAETDASWPETLAGRPLQVSTDAYLLYETERYALFNGKV